MVQQLSLVSVIDDDSLDLFISTIIASYGVSPILFSNLNTVWRPNPLLQISNVNAKNQIVEPTRLKLSKDIPLRWLLDKEEQKNDETLNNSNIDYKFIKKLTNNELPIDVKLIDNLLNNIGDITTKKSDGMVNSIVKKEEIKEEEEEKKPVDQEVIEIDDTKNENVIKIEDETTQKNEIIKLEDDKDEDIKMEDVEGEIKPEETNIPKSPKVIKSEDKINSNIKFNDKTNWCISISDIPAAGNNRKVLMQNVNETVIQELSGKNISINKFMNELYYQIEYKFINVGVKFYLKNNIVLELIKIWDFDSKRQVTQGGFYIRAYTNINKATDIDHLNFAEKMLLHLKKDLANYVEFEMPDRKSMDSRININNI